MNLYVDFVLSNEFTLIRRSNRPNSSILLDCGEGTLGQMCRFYGSVTDDVIRNIKALHITHMHGDHHMGIIFVIIYIFTAYSEYLRNNQTFIRYLLDCLNVTAMFSGFRNISKYEVYCFACNQ